MKIKYKYFAYYCSIFDDVDDGDYQTIPMDYLEFISVIPFYEYSHTEDDTIFFRKKHDMPNGYAHLIFIKAVDDNG